MIKLPINYNILTWQQRKQVRTEYIKLQDNKCYYCGANLYDKPDETVLKKRIDKNLFPKNFFQYSIHLHHNHNTGMTIGAVHNYCNAVLWQYHNE